MRTRIFAPDAILDALLATGRWRVIYRTDRAGEGHPIVRPAGAVLEAMQAPSWARCFERWGLSVEIDTTVMGRDSGWVYFIGATEGPIKIGFTRSSPEWRRRKLQTGSPVLLGVIYSVRVWDQSAETALLRYLRKWITIAGPVLVHGEWVDRIIAQEIIDQAKANGDCLCATLHDICGSRRWHCVKEAA